MKFITCLSAFLSQLSGRIIPSWPLKLYWHWKVKRKTWRFWLHFSHFLTSVLCLVLFVLSRVSCADTDSLPKNFDLRGIATAMLFRRRWSTNGMHYSTNLVLLTTRWSATTGCFIKALKVSSFYRDKKKVSPIKYTHRYRHTATKRQTCINHAFILSLQGFAIRAISGLLLKYLIIHIIIFYFYEALSHLYTTTPIALVRVLHFQNSAASLAVYFIHFGCCIAPNSILPWSKQCIKAHYSNAGVLWFVLLLVLDIKCLIL